MDDIWKIWHFWKIKEQARGKKIDKFPLKLSWSETNLSIETVAFFKDRLFCRITRLKNEINNLNFFQSLKLSVFGCPGQNPAQSIQLVFLKKDPLEVCTQLMRRYLCFWRETCLFIDISWSNFFVCFYGFQDSKAKNEFETKSIKLNYTGTSLVEMKTRNKDNLVWLAILVVTTVVFGLSG